MITELLNYIKFPFISYGWIHIILNLNKFLAKKLARRHIVTLFYGMKYFMRVWKRQCFSKKSNFIIFINTLWDPPYQDNLKIKFKTFHELSWIKWVLLALSQIPHIIYLTHIYEIIRWYICICNIIEYLKAKGMINKKSNWKKLHSNNLVKMILK